MKKEGDKRHVICHNCGKSEATYLLRNVDFSDKSGTVENILSAVCDKCNEVVSIPAQSTTAIKATLDRMNKEAASMEIFDLNTKEGVERFLKFYGIK